jgi:DNA-binding response OmpR family regulator
MAIPQHPHAATHTQVTKNAGLGGRRVLLVEDDDLVAAGVSSLLEMEGFVVQIIDRGLAVVDAVTSFEPDALILDVTLPDISGVEVFRRVRRRWPDLPVLFSTGYGDGQVAGLKGKAVEMLQKPYEIADLLSALRRLTGS